MIISLLKKATSKYLCLPHIIDSADIAVTVTHCIAFLQKRQAILCQVGCKSLQGLTQLTQLMKVCIFDK